jgi:hypothetical protein
MFVVRVDSVGVDASSQCKRNQRINTRFSKTHMHVSVSCLFLFESFSYQKLVHTIYSEVHWEGTPKKEI